MAANHTTFTPAGQSNSRDEVTGEMEVEASIEVPELSIVVPLYDEAPSVAPLCAGIRHSLESLNLSFETILVDDGSKDATFIEAERVALHDRRFQVIKLKSNFGQTAALHAGISQARGQIIISMDGDLQNDPEDIGPLISKIAEGYDVVSGWREDRKDRFLIRRLPSLVANWIVRKVARVPIRDNGCGLRAYRADIIRSLSLYSEMHRLLPAIMAMTGARIAEIPVRHHARLHGKSKYGLSRIYKFVLDLTALKVVMTAFRLPMFGFGLPAVVCLMLSTAALIGGIFHLIKNPDASLIIFIGATALLAMLSLWLMTLGIICELIFNSRSQRIDAVPVISE
jgi:glycosyltransferase involved in cell wall biosynthesis